MAVVDPLNLWKAPQQVDNFVGRYPELKPIADQVSAKWINNQTDANAIPSYVTAAGTKTLLLCIYAIPKRDFGAYSDGGFPDRASYLQFLTDIKNNLGTQPAIITYEPDALGLASNYPEADRIERIETLRQGIGILSTIANAETYIDASMWHDASTTQRDLLRSVDIQKIAGVTLNTSAFYAQSTCYTYGDNVTAALAAVGITGKRYIIDTSRNGNGPITEADRPMASPWIDTGQTWCNPLKRRIGVVPGTAASGRPSFRANVWVKQPGESDGLFPSLADSPYFGENAPSAGTFWVPFARDMLGLTPQSTTQGATVPTISVVAADFESGWGSFTINSASTSLVAGRARIPAATTYPNIDTAKAYGLTGGTVAARLRPVTGFAATATDVNVMMSVLSATAGTRVTTWISSKTNQIRFGNETGYWDAANTTIAYDATAMAHVRMREASGTLYWETSPDATTWTVRKQIATPAWAAAETSSVQIVSYADVDGGYAEVDWVNIIPGTTPDPVTTTFTGADGAAWPAPWTGGTGNTIQLNRGRQRTPATAWSDTAATANLTIANGRVDATVRLPVVPGVSARIDVRFNPTTGNGYRLIIPTDYAGFQLVKVVNWAETAVVEEFTLTWAANTDYRVAVDFVGTTIRAKRWLVGATEPTAWNITGTDGTHTSGNVRLVAVTTTATAADVLWDDVVLTTAPVAPVAPAPTVPPALTNPERGWFYYTQTHAPGAAATTYDALTASGLQAARDAGQTMVFRYIILDQFLGTDTISQAYKDLLAADLTLVRNAGMKMIPRFVYSNSGKMTAPYNADAPVARVLTHIQQLATVVNANADIIDVIQQGFIGMWGEQYYTDNYGDVGTLTAQNWTDRKAVLNAMLDNFDARIFIQLRYVGMKRTLINEGLSFAKQDRLGFHNDAFLAPSDDYGTYHTFTTYTATENRAWLEAHVAEKRLPMGGESADLNGTGSQLEAARVQLAKNRYTYLNPNYHPDVLASWGQAGRDEVGAKLGYNFALSNIITSSSGTDVTVGFTVTNDGYAAPYRSHPVLVDFVSGSTTVTRTLAADTKNWVPGTTNVSGTVATPGAGTWAVHLRIVDPSTSLQTNVLYNMRVRGAGAYNITTGATSLGQSVTTAAAPVSSSTTAAAGASVGLTATATSTKRTTAAAGAGAGASATATSTKRTTAAAGASVGLTATATATTPPVSGVTTASAGAAVELTATATSTKRTTADAGAAAGATATATSTTSSSTTATAGAAAGATATATSTKRTTASAGASVGLTATATATSPVANGMAVRIIRANGAYDSYRLKVVGPNGTLVTPKGAKVLR